MCSKGNHSIRTRHLSLGMFLGAEGSRFRTCSLLKRAGTALLPPLKGRAVFPCADNWLHPMQAVDVLGRSQGRFDTGVVWLMAGSTFGMSPGMLSVMGSVHVYCVDNFIVPAVSGSPVYLLHRRHTACGMCHACGLPLHVPLL